MTRCRERGRGAGRLRDAPRMRLERLRPDERPVAGEHEHVARESRRALAAAQSVACPVPCCRSWTTNCRSLVVTGEDLSDLFGAVTDDEDDALGSRGPDRVDHPADHRADSATSWTTLGRSLIMRVPLPAARMIAASRRAMDAENPGFRSSVLRRESLTRPSPGGARRSGRSSDPRPGPTRKNAGPPRLELGMPGPKPGVLPITPRASDAAILARLRQEARTRNATTRFRRSGSAGTSPRRPVLGAGAS